MKDGIYKASNGISYFILNEKILIKVLGTMYKTNKMFLLFNYIIRLMSYLVCILLVLDLY